MYIYHNKQLIATHEITSKLINYAHEHYAAGLKTSMPYKNSLDIDKYAKENLEKFDNLLWKK